MEHKLAPVRHTFIRAQTVPMGPLSIRHERHQPGIISDMDHKKRVFSVQGEGEDGQKEKREGRQKDPVGSITGSLRVE